MEIIYGLDNAKLKHPTVVTMGMFDGLHLGHQAIINTVVERALLINATPSLITFEPHPRMVLQPDFAPPLLQTFHQKMEGLKLLGIKQIVVLEFNQQLASKSADDFIQSYIVDYLNAREVYLGQGFAFGRERRGNIELLKQMSASCGFHADEVPEVQLRGRRISSTAVRHLIKDGSINQARRMLGRGYGVEGTVVKGKSIGKTIGFPTLNIDVYNRIIPADGVYITLCLLGEKWYRSVTNIGKRPTIDGGDVESKVETHLLDYDGDLYGQTVRVRMLHRLREEKKFPGIDALKNQINHDVQRTRRYFNSYIVRRNLTYS